MNPIEKDPLLTKLEITNWIVLGICLLLGTVFMSAKFSLGILLGGIISIINFHWMKRDLHKIFSSLTDKSKGTLMLRYYIRFGVTAVILFLIISQSLVDIFGLLVGLSVVILNIVLTTVMIFSKKNRIEEVN